MALFLHSWQHALKKLPEVWTIEAIRMSHNLKAIRWVILLVVIIICTAFAGCTDYQKSPGPATTP